MTKRIYLDHAATTPMRPEAVAAVEEGMRRWANPSSPHAEGRAARAALEDARARIKVALGWDGELIFTSGASEALAIGLGRARAERRLVSAVEHDAVFRAAPDAIVIPMASDCALDRDALADALAKGGRTVVAIQSVNSETGQMQDIDTISAQVRAAGSILLSDCAQAAGKRALPDADLIVVSAHKTGGPPGIGALLVRDFAILEASGGQEFGYRQGTENLPGALGFAAALEASAFDMAGKPEWLSALDRPLDHLDLMIAEGGGLRIGSQDRSPAIRAYAMPGLSATVQLIRLDGMGFAVSAGSACSSGTLKQSRALAAFGIAPDTAARTIRMSAGWSTSEDELMAFGMAWRQIVDDARGHTA